MNKNKVESILPEQGKNIAIYDYAIIGAGGAGMCLLMQLLKRPFFKDKRIVVFEPEAKTTDDKTWCFWSLPEDKAEEELIALADCHWDKFRTTSGRVVQSSYQYHHLPSSVLYNTVHQLAAGHAAVNWVGEKVMSTKLCMDGVLLKTAEKQYTAAIIFDSRFNEKQVTLLRSPATIWQSFIGWKIKLNNVDYGRDAVSLMDFNIAQHGNTQFIYYLPFDKQEALVELTRFGKHAIEEHEAEELIAAWITEHFGTYERLHTEEGKIPMVQGLKREAIPNGRIVPIGTAAGAVKSTTGYAIKNMHRHATQMADALERNQSLPSIDQEQRFAFYDDLLLHILRNKPEKGKQIFEQLFQRNIMDRIFRFLDERTTVIEELPMLFSLPVKAFLSALYEKHRLQTTLSSSNVNVAVNIGLLMFLTVGLYQFEVISSQQLTYLMLIGLIFPGIPHGAMDHYLGKGKSLKGMALIQFVGKYLGVMALVILLWSWNASLGVSIFILYSAWHFGETDLREWGIFNRVGAVVFGLAALSVILFSHSQELGEMLYLLKAESLANLTLPYSHVLLTGSCMIMLLPLLRIKLSVIYSYLLLLLILLMGSFLPLIPAFLWYFAAWHSFLGWLHIKKISGDTHVSLIKKSLPFSLGAFALFLGLYLLLPELAVDATSFIPYIFIFLAAISAPHVLFMHLYYEHNHSKK